MKKLKLLIIMIMMFLISKIDIVAVEYVYEEYKIGDKITYNDMNFYVIENSNKNQDYVTLLKETPLTVDEVNKYGVDENGISHVNIYVIPSYYPGYQKSDGGMAYYMSSTCGHVNDSYVDTGCTTDYDQSEVKYVVDAWTTSKFAEDSLKKDKFGYKSRLITYDELVNNLGFIQNENSDQFYPSETGFETPLWVHRQGYSYWTMSSYDDSNSEVWFVSDSTLHGYSIGYWGGRVRPVVNLSKKTIENFKAQELTKTLEDKEFKVGDIVEYNDIKFYVIKNSSRYDHTVTLLKAEPLKTVEMNKLISAIEVIDYVGDNGGYLTVPYLMVDNCSSVGDSSGCTTDYSLSIVKQIVDVWSKAMIDDSDLREDEFGYKARLLMLDDLKIALGLEVKGGTSYSFQSTNYSWLYTPYLYYWTMSSFEDYSDFIWVVTPNSMNVRSVYHYKGSNYGIGIRPVITLKKSYDENEIDDNVLNNQTISIPDTFLARPIIFVIIGIVFIIIGMAICYIAFKKEKNTKGK